MQRTKEEIRSSYRIATNGNQYKIQKKRKAYSIFGQKHGERWEDMGAYNTAQTYDSLKTAVFYMEKFIMNDMVELKEWTVVDLSEFDRGGG